MPTYTALTTLKGEVKAQELGAALEMLDPAPTGIGVFEVENGTGLWEVGGYFVDPPDEIALALLAAAHSAKPFVISHVPDKDWVAHVRRELEPVEAGRFFVYGDHDSEKVPETKVPLLIEASMAFGTGHHGTTLGCLLALEDFLNEGGWADNIIDIGCGTAVLAMAAASVMETSFVIASDIDPIAVDVANTNLKCNALNNKVKCYESVGFDHNAIAKSAPFDLIFANILKGPLVNLAPDIVENCAYKGTIILSGLLTNQSEDVQEVYENIGFKLSQRRDISEWTTLRMIKN